jgi:FkbM family methyltransferase
LARPDFELAFSFEDFLPFKPPALHILDVGALLEGDPIYSALLNREETTVTGFEPQDDARQELTVKFGARGQWFAHVLGDGGTHTFYKTRYPGCSSILEPNSDVINAFTAMSTKSGGNFEIVSEQQVQTARLNDLDDIQHVDFAKLDVQGAELMVMEHGMSKLASSLIIQTEAAFLPLYKSQPLFADQHLFLRNFNFDLHKFIDVTGRAFIPMVQSNPKQPVSQLIECDAVFVRGLMNPELLSVEELLTACLVLHDVFCSYDVVHRFLVAHDKKATVQTADRYMEALRDFKGRLPVRFLNLKL